MIKYFRNFSLPRRHLAGNMILILFMYISIFWIYTQLIKNNEEKVVKIRPKSGRNDNNYIKKAIELKNLFKYNSKETGIGEGGDGIQLKNLSKTEIINIENSYKKYGINEIASKKISLWRSLKDYRPNDCSNIFFPMPKVTSLYINQVYE